MPGKSSAELIAKYECYSVSFCSQTENHYPYQALEMDNIHQLIFRLLVALSLSACDSTESTKTLSDAVNSNAPPQEVSLNLDERETLQSNIEPKKRDQKRHSKRLSGLISCQRET